MIGVSFNNRQKRWRASYKDIHLGSFTSQRAAELARRAYMTKNDIKPIDQINRNFFSITASNSVWTMWKFPLVKGGRL
jgi:hypothetical protein